MLGVGVTDLDSPGSSADGVCVTVAARESDSE